MMQLRCLRGVGCGIVLTVFAGTVSEAEAQTQSLFGSRGPAGQIGSNLTGSSVGQGTTFGTGGTPFGATGMSGQPISGATGGIGGVGQTGGTIQQGQAGTQGAFIGRDDNAGRFVGNQLAGQQTGFSGGGSQFRNFGARGTRRSNAAFNQERARSQADSSRLVFRPRQRIAFSYPQPESSQIERALTSQFDRLANRTPGLSGVNVLLNEEGTATLQGTVDSAETKRLAAIMARMEPGVRTVRNELTVRGNGPSDQAGE